MPGKEQETSKPKRQRVFKKPLVLLDVSLPDAFHAQLASECEVVMLSDSNSWQARCSEVHAVFSYQHVPITASLLASFPELRVVSNFGAGYDHIDVAACAASNVALGNTPGVVADATADMAIALALAGRRNVLTGHVRYHANPKFDPNWWGENFSHATVGIIGLGNIGQKIAQRAKAFGTRTLYWGRSRKTGSVERGLGVEFCADLKELLRQSDVVMVCVAVTADTRNLIGKAEFLAMKSTALLVNVARGKIIDTEALVQALKDGEIAKAALDVTEPEPLPAGHPLLRMENVLLTPHLGTAEWSTRSRMMTMALDNLTAGLARQPLPNPVPEIQAPLNGSTRLKLVIGNKAYSSWSLRAWLACRVVCPFEESVVPLAGAGSEAQKQVLLQYSPTGKVPALTDRQADLVIWDSLAICEYLAELYPEAHLWPLDMRARALARSVCNEMHSGFQRLRAELPMNCRRDPVKVGIGEHEALQHPGVQQDVERICEIWENCLTSEWRTEGNFLLGQFGIVDAMFAPVVLRFATYKPEIPLRCQQYCSSIRNMPDIKEWIHAAREETWHIDQYEDL